MSASDWVDVGVKVTKQFGMTDELVQKYIGSSTIFCGVTDISVFPPQHVLLTDASSLGEAFYWTTLSQRIFPFYRYPGYYKGMLIGEEERGAKRRVKAASAASCIILVSMIS
jgi:hypothetical protein